MNVPPALRRTTRIPEAGPHTFVCLEDGRLLALDAAECDEPGDYVPPVVLHRLHDVAARADVSLHEALVAVLRAGYHALGTGDEEDRLAAVAVWRRLHGERPEGDDDSGNVIRFPT